VRGLGIQPERLSAHHALHVVDAMIISVKACRGEWSMRFTRTVHAKFLQVALAFIALQFTELGKTTIKRADSDLAVDILG
jgi:hypothetical protein